MRTLTLTRKRSGPDGTFGELALDGHLWATAELPWRGNVPRKSCVPEGTYLLVKHNSPLVTRITKGRHTWTWMLKDVEGRTYILLHPANWPHELEGCIAPGLSRGVLNGLPAVLSSQVAYDELMAAIGDGPARLIISWDLEEYP